jgi:excisionase family DNA binding protein
MARRSRAAVRNKTTPPPPSPSGDLLDLDQAIGVLKTTRPTFYRWLRTGRLKGMKLGRQWRFRREDLDRFLAGESPRLDLPVSPAPLEAALRQRVGKVDGDEPGDVIERIVLLMLRLARRSRASDLHVLPLQSDDQPAAEIRLRIDGVLQPQCRFDIRLLPAVATQWKRLASCDVHEKQRPQDGRLRIDLDGTHMDVRVSILPSHIGESITARLLVSADLSFELARYITRRPLQILLKHLASPHGVIVINGPTGSGKTSTLYACLKHLTSENLKLVSLEDPVEYALPGVVQVSVQPALGITFPYLLRATLRGDADVIMVGEIRDQETARLCMIAAMTGHRVLTTLHTRDSAAAVLRLRDIGVEPFVIGDGLRLVVAQRLVRRLCPHCKRPAKPPTDLLARAQALLAGAHVPTDLSAVTFYEPAGCDECVKLGYRGRNAVYELLEMSPEIAAALRRDAGERDIREIAVRQGTIPLAVDALRLASEGTTSLLEALHVSPVE